MTREQILTHYRERLSRAMEGKESMADVCGLAVEDLRASIQAERDHLLEKFGHEVLPQGDQPSSSNP